jgi:hypothetical protein
MGLKDALKAAIQALQRKWGNSTAIAGQEQDKSTLMQRWQNNNVQKLPNARVASQAVIAYCACLLSSPYISFLPSPPPVCPLSVLFTSRTNGRYQCFHPSIISSRSLALSLSRSPALSTRCLIVSLSRSLVVSLSRFC